MTNYQCSRSCKTDDFIIKPLLVAIHTDGSSAYYQRYYSKQANGKIVSKFLKTHQEQNRMKCKTCNYVTQEPVERIREILKNNSKYSKLRCPCCRSVYSRQARRH